MAKPHSFRGIIPARAGFTRQVVDQFFGGRDHPRSRGVYCGTRSTTGSTTGSSPLARGLPDFKRAGEEATRIIPARAGFTEHYEPHYTRRRDHPRSRGVYTFLKTRSKRTGGSSPLARGLRPGRLRVPRRHRIIPTRAGFTSGTRRATRNTADHPRSRGVYCPPLRCAPSRPGSSPLARGLLEGCVGEKVSDRIIPARAGFTGGRARHEPGVPDHPRSRGVYGDSRPDASKPRGSSPLARGLRIGRPRALTATRIIPARAGFTWSRAARG